MPDNERYKAPFYDSNSQASNQGQLNVNIMQWIKMNPTSVIINIALLVVSYIMMTRIHWVFGLTFLAALLYNVWYWISIMNKFKAGDVNIGRVVSVNPDRIAVATNMTKLGGNYPIVKIVEKKLLPDEKELGCYIPTIALYNDNPYDYPFWAEFHPVPLSHGVKDENVLMSKYDSFSESDFATLDSYIAELSTMEPGTYKVQVEDSDWKDYPKVEVGKLSKMKDTKKD